MEFHHITFHADGTFTSDATTSVVEINSNGTYTIPTTDSGVSDDYSILGLAFGGGFPDIFVWEISADGKTLTLSLPENAGAFCSLTRS